VLAILIEMMRDKSLPDRGLGLLLLAAQEWFFSSGQVRSRWTHLVRAAASRRAVGADLRLRAGRAACFAVQGSARPHRGMSCLNLT
jgi:hypothetical protein